MTNFKLTIEYDGTAYHGWQRQAGDRTIQETIETALTTMTEETIRLHGSGRTDAGVHALGQTAHFHTSAAIPAEGFSGGLNSLTPDDIIIRSCEMVPEDFHARFSAKKKTYHYIIQNTHLPPAIGRQYVWWVQHPIEIEYMKKNLDHIIGTHDFKSFEGTGSPKRHTIRTVFEANIQTEENGRIFFSITADGFLRYMVRNIVGTLVDVGKGVLLLSDFKSILLAKDRNRAGATAPPQGLFLVSVHY